MKRSKIAMLFLRQSMFCLKMALKDLKLIDRVDMCVIISNIEEIYNKIKEEKSD